LGSEDFSLLATIGTMNASHALSRRDFLLKSACAVTGSALAAYGGAAEDSEPIIDIHQHCNYGGERDAQYHPIGPARSDEEVVAHQRAMKVSKTVMLPAGTPAIRPSTHAGFSNGLEGTCAGNESCMALAGAYPGEFYFGSNELPDLAEAPATIENFLKKGAVCIGEQKFGVECDSPQMEALYRLAAAYQVPILMHWQYGTYNYGFDRFYKMLEKHAQTSFVGHAQTLWAHIDKVYQDDAKNLYPSGKITAGGWTDRYLSDYPNFFADLSADSGHNALTRDPDFIRPFLVRHQDKLIFGSDCSDKSGHDITCTGWMTIRSVRELAASKKIERKLLYENARRVYRL
jgi:predicted TIM-barrel fold metal-dependent hydrolase